MTESFNNGEDMGRKTKMWVILKVFLIKFCQTEAKITITVNNVGSYMATLNVTGFWK